MKNKSIPLHILLFILICLGILIRNIYHFFIISIDGGITLIESNYFIAITELIIMCIAFLFLSIFTFKSILNYSEKFVEKIRG